MKTQITRRTGLLGIIAVAFAGLLSVTTPATAQVAADAAGKFVQSLGDKVVAVVADGSATQDKRQAVFRALLNENFDVQTIGRFVLGRYWNAASQPQREEYQKLFENMIVGVYAERFGQYSGEQFKVTGSRPEGERDALVTSQVLRPNGPPVNVSWRVRQKDGGFKIIDVVVENVSMSVTQRSEFASVIESNGGRFDALLDALRQRTRTAQTQ
ncbi:MAG TPA: ABC transporter substrate-binding protein [Azospirillaceae bacterium]|nr:ABC transporter substrate-binding protein [Azospirillaceae bacterium]